MRVETAQIPVKSIQVAPNAGAMFFGATAQVIVTTESGQTYVTSVEDTRRQQTNPAPNTRIIMDYRSLIVKPVNKAPVPNITTTFHIELAISAILHFANQTPDDYGLTAYISEQRGNPTKHIYLNYTRDPESSHIIYEIVLEQDENGKPQVRFGTRSKNDLESLYGSRTGTPTQDPYAIAVANTLLHAILYYEENITIPF